jgi:hypothetical protein
LRCYGTAHDLLLSIHNEKKSRFLLVYQETAAERVESFLQNAGEARLVL